MMVKQGQNQGYFRRHNPNGARPPKIDKRKTYCIEELRRISERILEIAEKTKLIETSEKHLTVLTNQQRAFVLCPNENYGFVVDVKATESIFQKQKAELGLQLLSASIMAHYYLTLEESCDACYLDPEIVDSIYSYYDPAEERLGFLFWLITNCTVEDDDPLNMFNLLYECVCAYNKQ